MTEQAPTLPTVRTIDLWIAGKAKGKDRPRFSRATGRTFTTAATTNAEANIVQVWREAGEPRLPDGPVRLLLTILVERPGGHYRKDGYTLSATGAREPFPSRQKPDVDNAVKLAMDALNGRAYKDDVQVVEATIVRLWGDRAGVKVHLSSLAPVEVAA